MAKFLRRVGKKKHQFQLEAYIEKVYLAAAFECELSVLLKRGDHKAQTVRQGNDVAKGYTLFMEPLDVPVALYYDEKRNKYLEQKCSFTVIIHTARGNRIAGTADLDLSAYPNNNNLISQESIKLKSTDPNAKLQMRIKMEFIGEDKNESSRISEERNSQLAEESYIHENTSQTQRTEEAEGENFMKPLQSEFQRDEEAHVPEEKKGPRGGGEQFIQKGSRESIEKARQTEGKPQARWDDFEDLEGIIPTVQAQNNQVFEVKEASQQELKESKPADKLKSQTHRASDVITPKKTVSPIVRTQSMTGSTGTKPIAPNIVLNTPEIEKKLKSINIFKMNPRDSDKKEEVTQSQTMRQSEPLRQSLPSRLSREDQEISAEARKYVDELFEHVFEEEQAEPKPVYLKKGKSEPPKNISAFVLDKGSPVPGFQEFEHEKPRKEESPKRIEEPQLNESDKDEPLNLLESKDMEINRLRIENQSQKEQIQQKDMQIMKFKALLEAAKKDSERLTISRTVSTGGEGSIDRLNALIVQQNAKISVLSTENLDLKEKTKRIDDLELELDNVRDKLKEAEAQCKALSDQNDLLEHKCAKLDRELAKLKTSYFTLNQENAANLEKYHALAELNKEKTNAVQAAILEAEEANVRYQNLEKENDRLCAEVAKAQEMVNTLRARGNELAKKATEMQVRLTAEKKELEEKLKAKDDELKIYKSYAENTIEELERQLEAARKEAKVSRQTELALQLEKLKSDLEEIQKEIENDSSANKTAAEEQQPEALQKENIQLKSLVSVLEASLKENEERHVKNQETTNKEMRWLNSKCLQLEEENQKLHSENEKRLKDMLSETAELKNQIAILKQENENLLAHWQEKINEKEARCKALEEENKGLSRNLVQLQKDVSTEAISQDHKEVQVSGVGQLLQTAEISHHLVVEGLEKEIERLKLELQAAKEQAARPSNDDVIASLQLENDKLKREVKELYAKLASEKPIDDSSLEVDNQSLQQKLSRLTKENKRYEEQIQQLYATLRRFNSEEKEKESKAENEPVENKTNGNDMKDLVLEAENENPKEKEKSVININ